MSTSSATPPATRRIAKSYLTDFIAAAPLPNAVVGNPRAMIAPIVEQLLDRALKVRHVLRADQLVLTFDLADDPAGWTTTPGLRMPGTTEPADVDGRDAAGTGDPWRAPLAGNIEVRDPRPENQDYPGQPAERTPDL